MASLQSMTKGRVSLGVDRQTGEQREGCAWICSCLMFLKHGFKDAVLWVSLFLSERAGLPRGSDTLRCSAASLSSALVLR